ncbi:hypothetical protein H257_03495 [Aphanomyces astaci]|uniref:Inward rectifier potassium channel C-terminal domain-containing protein n=1 Tax=Aphanomyces astaci TaxID=112090 RepID=W4GX29_APHAT|nr:hypothetical protein H257_03495 [Aphanomyces astaci]ETV84232.1 hypothetical protein H257_03495 [Aphanomyces astaci]|eukprot:XP_009825924.1 hypothetical protein H257_03495 [Aphanomyces astaci]
MRRPAADLSDDEGGYDKKTSTDYVQGGDEKHGNAAAHPSKCRMIDRSAGSNHSLGTWNIRRLRASDAYKRYLSAPFHTLVNMSVYKVVIGLSLVYLTVIAVFGLLYLSIDSSCNLAIATFPQGFIFSVSVLFTIGFGVGGNDVFFNSCGSAITLITAQTIVGVFLDAMAFGIFYQRFARGQSRANTIRVSAFACVQKIRGHLYFTFQTCEMRKHQLSEAHVRCYAVLHKSVHFPHQVHHMQAYPMRLQQPDDDLNGWLILALPTICVHRLDAWSPLAPPPLDPEPTHNPATQALFPEPPQRAVDIESGTRENKYRVDKPALFNSATTNVLTPVTKADIDRLLRFWSDTEMEVVVVVEGVDAATSSTTQMRHSFKAHDVVFNEQFVNCVFIDNETGGAIIDFKHFDRTTPLDFAAIPVTTPREAV